MRQRPLNSMIFNEAMRPDRIVDARHLPNDGQNGAKAPDRGFDRTLKPNFRSKNENGGGVKENISKFFIILLDSNRLGA